MGLFVSSLAKSPFVILGVSFASLANAQELSDLIDRDQVALRSEYLYVGMSGPLVTSGNVAGGDDQSDIVVQTPPARTVYPISFDSTVASYLTQGGGQGPRDWLSGLGGGDYIYGSSPTAQADSSSGKDDQSVDSGGADSDGGETVSVVPLPPPAIMLLSAALLFFRFGRRASGRAVS